MTRVGIVGLGFMGKMHFRCYKALENVELVAICDADKKKFEQTQGTAGNMEGAEKPLDFTGIDLYEDFDKMLAEANLDAVSITLPTYMHREYTAKAFQAGLNVLCEKPMATTESDCEKMIAAAKKSGKTLQIGHCIRFWPEYAKTKQIVDSGKYGKVMAATFQRLSLTPVWSWDNWLLDGPRGEGAVLDLHIHDADFVQYLFGMPKSVFSRGIKGPSKDYDHIVTQYIYDTDTVVTAEGGWIMQPGFGFEMSFNIILETATILFDVNRDPVFRICPAEGKDIIPQIEPGDGYSREIEYFINILSAQKVEEIITPQQSKDSIKLIKAEKRSAASGKIVKL